MSLTLKDVVENQTRLRASGLRRDAADTHSLPQGGRERFFVDTSERPVARTRPSSAGSDAAKTQASRTDTTQRKDEPARTARSTDSKPEAHRADRTDAAKKPATSSPADKPQDASAAKGEAADSSNAKATAGGLGTSEPVSGDATSAATAPSDTSSIAALFVAPPAVTPPPLPKTALGGDAGATEDASEIGGTEGVTKGAAASDLKPGAASTAGGAAKPDFQAMLGDAAAAARPGDAGQAVAAPSTDVSGVAGSSTAPSAPTEAKAAAATQPTAPATPTTPPIPLGAVPMTIGLRALGDLNRFEIRLDPKELGRIDVSIDIDKDSGTVGARLVVDRPETLALLQRDASSLQQALSQTGLDASAGISLSLRGDGAGQGNGNAFGANGQQQGADQTHRTGQQAGTDQAPIDLMPLRSLTGLGRVDIRI